MLGKLLKHEWKNTYRVGGLMMILIAVVTFFGWLAFQTPMWQAMADGRSYDSVSVVDMTGLATIFLYAIMLIGVSFGMIIYLGIHFYKTMYTDEGYLTHTLPATKGSIFGSKVFMSGLWYLLVEIAVMISAFVISISAVFALIPSAERAELMKLITENWSEVVEFLRSELGINLGRWGVMAVISTIVSPFCTMIILFGAISLGQLFGKHRVLMAIVSYVGIMVVNMIVSSAVQSTVSLRAIENSASSSMLLDGYVNSSAMVGMAQDVVFAVILYIASYFIISKKLNLE